MFHIGVDIDGVLADSNNLIIGEINRQHGLNITASMVKDYWFQNEEVKHIKPMVDKLWREFDTNDMLLRTPLMPSAELFHMLPGYTHIATHRPEINKKMTTLWLHFNGFDTYDSLTFAKGPKSKFGKWDYFIEDCTENAIDLAESGSVARKVLLLEHPYNENDIVPENVVKISTWEDIIEFFKKEILSQKEKVYKNGQEEK